MIITDISLKKIEPSKGMRLTNSIDIAENEIYLANGDSPENWYEITVEEAEKIQAERSASDGLLCNSG